MERPGNLPVKGRIADISNGVREVVNSDLHSGLPAIAIIWRVSNRLRSALIPPTVGL
jgi:hypothetical protein